LRFFLKISSFLAKANFEPQGSFFFAYSCWVLCFVFCREKELSQVKHANQGPPLSLSLSQIFCIDQLVQSYFKRVEVLGSSLHFVGADFFIPAHSRTLPETSTIFFQKAITSSSGSLFQSRFF
jgi:hypothetical protein